MVYVSTLILSLLIFKSVVINGCGKRYENLTLVPFEDAGLVVANHGASLAEYFKAQNPEKRKQGRFMYNEDTYIYRANLNETSYNLYKMQQLGKHLVSLGKFIWNPLDNVFQLIKEIK